MKQILFFLILLSVQLNLCAADSISSSASHTPIEHLVAFGNRLPQEKVYLHLDNNCYFIGDKIWYKAYVTRSDNNKLTDISTILYVELFTPDGYLVERQQVPLTELGNGFGAFELKDSLYSGYYELRAYTRWQLNFGLYEHDHAFQAKDRFYTKRMGDEFFRDYEKLYSRVFPVYDKPQEEGVFSKVMTTRPLRRYFSEDKNKSELKTTFFPEGGNLVKGLASRVAFECVDHEGKHVKANGVIQNRAGEEVATFSTLFRGRGLFDLPPAERAGDEYSAVISWENNKYTYKLPAVSESGCVVHIQEMGDSIRVHLAAQQLTPETAASLQATVMCGGKVSLILDLSLDETGEVVQLIPKAKLRTGVNNITVVDKKGEVFADRLFFVNHLEYQRAKLLVSGLKEEYAPHEAIVLTLQLKESEEPAELSISIRDNSTDENSFDDSNILTEMLLGSEVKGFIESPSYYFEENDEARKAHLDLLLMVQGWRRYVWRDMAAISGFGLSHFPEKFQAIEGSVHKLILKQLHNTDDEEGGGSSEEQAMAEMISSTPGPPPVESSSETNVLQRLLLDQTVNPRQKLERKFTQYRLLGDPALKFETDVLAEYVFGRKVEINDQLTTDGYFKLLVPPYFGKSITFLSASKSKAELEEELLTSKKKRKRVSRGRSSRQDEEGIPDFYVKRDLFFPLFVKPYSFYQEQSPDVVMTNYEKGRTASLNEMQWLDQVDIRAKRSGLRKVDYTKPAYVIDAYEMYNNVVDYGLAPSYFYGGEDFMTVKGSPQVYIDKSEFYDQVAFALCADMGRLRPYFVTKKLNDKAFNNIKGPAFNPYNFSFGEIDRDCRLRRMDKIYIYTDYEPRHEGDWRYEGDNQPEVVVQIRLFDKGAVRRTYKDRRYVLPGFSDCAEFYNPDYSRKKLPKTPDYRRTLYWNPVVKLEGGVQAILKLYNNSKKTTVRVRAEGITLSGIPVVME